jgi:hypothetical protein
METFFAAKFGTQHQPIRQRIAGKPVGMERLGCSETKHFAWPARVFDVQHDDGVELAHRIDPIVFEDYRNATGAAYPARLRLRGLWCLERENWV